MEVIEAGKPTISPKNKTMRTSVEQFHVNPFAYTIAKIETMVMCTCENVRDAVKIRYHYRIYRTNCSLIKSVSSLLKKKARNRTKQSINGLLFQAFPSELSILQNAFKRISLQLLFNFGHELKPRFIQAILLSTCIYKQQRFTKFQRLDTKT